MATVIKRCSCAKGLEDRKKRMRKWHNCSHPWKVLWRPAGSKNPKQRSFPSFKDAEAFRKIVEGEQAAGRAVLVYDGRVRFEEYAEKLLAQWPGTASSARTYASSLRRHAYPVLGHHMLEDITREHIIDLVKGMEEQTGEDGRPRYKPATIAGVYVAVAAIFSQARLNRRIAESPCVRVPLPDVVSGAILIEPSREQWERFVMRFPPDWRLPAWFMHGCGLRIGEALAINANDMLDDGFYRVRRQVDPEGRVIPCKWRRADEYRDVPVPEYVRVEFEQHVRWFPPDGDGFVVPGRKHARVVRNSYQEHFRAAVRVAGLPEFMTPHSLRHRWASVALGLGVPLTDVSAWLGHKQIETTYRIYRHMLPRVADGARRLLDEAFRNLPESVEQTGVDVVLTPGLEDED